MTDEPSLKTKTDVLDLVINFIMDHEKRMDQMVERLERLTGKLPNRINSFNYPLAPKSNSLSQPDVFSLVINNPREFDKIRSIKIDWEMAREEFSSESSFNTILNDLEDKLRED